MKLIFHLVVYAVMFAAGIGVGIHYSASNPDQATSIAANEDNELQRVKAELAQVKSQLTSKPGEPAAAQSPTDSSGHTKIYQDLTNGASKAIDNVGNPSK